MQQTLKIILYGVGVILFFAGCTPQVEPTRDLVPFSRPPETASIPVAEAVSGQVQATRTMTSHAPLEPSSVANRVSRCVSPSVAVSLNIDATSEAEHLNADTTAQIAILEYLIAEVDPEYTCGTLFYQTNAGAIRSIRVYKMGKGAQKYMSFSDPLQSALQNVSLLSNSGIVLLADFHGLLPQILVKKAWLSDQVITSPESLTATKRVLYTRLTDSNQSIFSKPVSAGYSTRESYNCSDFSSQAAAQTFFSGLTGDVDNLDSDSDGRACESLTNTSRRYQVTFADIPTAAPPPIVTPSFTKTYRAPTQSYSSGRCYVSGYTRKSGTRVSGYYRSC